MKARPKKASPRSARPVARAQKKPAARVATAALGKRLSPDQRRAQILEVAETLFAQRSYDDIGIADVARAAGITQGLLYHYFLSKEALFTAAVETSATDLLRRCFPDPRLPIPQQFEIGVKGYIDYVEAHRVAYFNLFCGPAATQVEFRRITDQTRQAIIDHIITVMGLAEHRIPATRVSLRGYVGYVEYAILEWVKRDDLPREKLERLIFAVIITALRTGLASDSDVPFTPSELAEFEHAYKRHFALA